MSLTWRQKRKEMFLGIISIIILSFLGYKIYPYFNTIPTCFDNKQNADERGVDCGGSCSLICKADVLPIEVKYARAVNTDENLYDLIALIENKNSNKNTEDGKINYKFNIYDKSGTVIKTIFGSSFLPLGQTFPIIHQNLELNFKDSGNSILKVTLDILDDKSWNNANSIYANNFFKVLEKRFYQNKNNISQLSVSIKNIAKADFRNVPVLVIIYDEESNIIGINESILDYIKAGESKDIVFTWRNILLVEDPDIDVYTIVTPFTTIK